MKIVVFEVEPWETQAFESLTGQHELVFVHEPLTADNVAQYADAELVSTFIYSSLKEPVLSQLPQLKLVATRSTGYDHIDVAACAQRGVGVANVPRYGDHTVAEHVFALLLALSHHLTEAVDRTRRGDFSLEGLRGFDLRGKTLGVIGTGHIGQCVIEIAKGFRMRVVAYDQQPDPSLAASLGFEYLDFDHLLAQADVLTLHIPGTAQTHHLLNEAAFAKMKDGVVLINTARGTVVDVHALLRALAVGKVAAAGLDVLPEEPTIREEAELIRAFFRKQHNLDTLLADHILLRMRNVIITPHSAFDTKEAVERILTTTVENLTAFCAGERLNRVEPQPAAAAR